MAVRLYYENPAHDATVTDRAGWLALNRGTGLQVLAYGDPDVGWKVDHGGGAFTHAAVWYPAASSPVYVDYHGLCNYLVTVGVLTEGQHVSALTARQLSQAGVVLGRTMTDAGWTAVWTRVRADATTRFGTKSAWSQDELAGVPDATRDAP